MEYVDICKGKFKRTDLSIKFESLNDEYAIVKEAQDANMLRQESKLTRVKKCS